MKTIEEVNERLCYEINLADKNSGDGWRGSHHHTVFKNVFGIKGEYHPLFRSGDLVKNNSEFVGKAFYSGYGWNIRSITVNWFYTQVFKKFHGDVVIHEESGYTNANLIDYLMHNRKNNAHRKTLASIFVSIMTTIDEDQQKQFYDKLKSELMFFVETLEGFGANIIAVNIDRIIYLCSDEQHFIKYDYPIHHDKHENIFVINKCSYIMNFDISSSSRIHNGNGDNRLLTNLCSGMKFEI